MNPNYPTPGPSSLPYYPELSHGYDEEEDSAYLSQAESLSGSYQSNDSAESLNTCGSSFHQSHQPNLYVSEYSSIPQFPNSTHQWSYPLPTYPLKDFPLTHDHVPDPSFDNPTNGIDPLRAAPGLGPYYPAHSGGSNMQMAQGETMGHSGYWSSLPLQDSQGDSGPSDLPGRTVDTLSPQFMVQDDYSYASSSRGQVEGASQSTMATQGQYATTGEALPRRQPKAVKKEKDKQRKRYQRSHDDENYERICDLLGLRYKPKTTLSDRNAIEVIVERQKVDSDLRQRLQGSEAYIRHMNSKLADFSIEEDTALVNAHTLPGDSDTGAWT